MDFTALQDSLSARPPQSLSVAWAVDSSVLKACVQAYEAGFVDEIVLTGPSKDIRATAQQGSLDISSFSIVEADSPQEGAWKAVQLIREGRCSVLMKGHLNTSVLLRAVLDKEHGIRRTTLLSHIAVIELPTPRLALLTDGAMNIAPDLAQKRAILDNAINFAWSLGIENPRAAVLASIESVNPNMQDTLDAACLTQMGRRGQFSRPAVVDGPLAFDNAYSLKAAQLKGLESPVAGKADIFLVPEITAGNILYKAFSYVGHLKTAGIIYGAASPIVLTSRADTDENKLNSIAVACGAASST